jgi:hypothetical protein
MSKLSSSREPAKESGVNEAIPKNEIARPDGSDGLRAITQIYCSARNDVSLVDLSPMNR